MKGKELSKALYALECGEELIPDSKRGYLRVPGGWVYQYGADNGLTSVFIPFNNEFMTNDFMHSQDGGGENNG